MNNIFLFSYGSNSIKQVKARICNTSHLTVYSAYIENYVRIFAGRSKRWDGGVASIYPLKDKNVYGIVIVLKKKDLEKLNEFEIGYHLEMKDVYFNGCYRKSYVYIKDNDNFDLLPSSSYLHAIDNMLNEREKMENRRILIRKLSSERKIVLLGYWSSLEGFVFS